MVSPSCIFVDDVHYVFMKWRGRYFEEMSFVKDVVPKIESNACIGSHRVRKEAILISNDDIELLAMRNCSFILIVEVDVEFFIS